MGGGAWWERVQYPKAVMGGHRTAAHCLDIVLETFRKTNILNN